MTSDEARELFSRAVDSELTAAEQAEFDEALAADRAVAAEFRVWKEMLGQKLSSFPPPASAGAPARDLTAGIQERLRTRSGGRIYRDRFSTMAKGQQTVVVIAAVACVVLLVAAWFAVSAVSDAGEDPRVITAPRVAGDKR